VHYIVTDVLIFKAIQAPKNM